MIKIRRISSVVGACAMLSMAFAPMALADPVNGASADPNSADDNIVTLDLYNLTDIHGHIEPVFDKYTSEAGLSHMACYINKARKANPNSQFTLLGDNIGASPFTSGTQEDNPTVDALNKMGVFASTIGNHEFDKGLDVLKARIKGTDTAKYSKFNFPYLGANIKGMEGYLEDYKMWISPSGVKVAFIGAIEDDVATKLFPGTVDSLTFHKPVPVINKLAQELKEVGGYATQADGSLTTDKVKADIVIAMFDNDVEQSYPKMGKYVDGLMGGDTHKPYYFTKVKGADGNILSATASGSFTDNLSNLQIKYDKKAGKVIDSQAIQITAKEVQKCGDDPEVKAVVDAAVATSEQIKNRVITSDAGEFYRGKQETVKDGSVTPGENRGTESTVGDLIGDVMKNSFPDLEGNPIDIGMVVAGDLRADLASGSGKITVGDIFKVMPWSNEISYVKMTGAKFKELLEQQWKELGEKSTRPLLKLNFSQNVKYTYDPARNRGDRITSILIDGKPIVADKLYTVAGSSFLMAGGDSFTVLQEPGISATLKTIPKKLDREWFEEYLQKNPKVQPRTHKSSIGVNIAAQKITKDNAQVKVSLRGLSFSQGADPVQKVKVKFGNAVQEAAVNNTLQDANAANYQAIVTADGVGYTNQAVTLDATGFCSGNAGKSVHVPLTVETESGVELVNAAHNLGLDVSCPSVEKQKSKAPKALAKTGASDVELGIAALLAVAAGVAGIGAVRNKH
ncbi:bifunctional UDP-sugar hydrolase/5'-nucleotidase [uncultured Arcanobacterium sp.]|uniref:bifunctional metallophosphatase/5'-nucleotidase n=1 Tax=uncultured Arcanobacterium sp. TaxID=487520 RepID=UPI002614D554|nr:bifunctional UDP-sugar hydrolase/5'-nucleotidase [uncultured Arcanobacterium sp.]